LSFLLAGHLVPLPAAAAASAQQMPEIAADNADIVSPRATIASLIRLTDVIHELVEDDGVTSENEVRLENIYQQIEKLFDLREVPPKYRRHVSAESAVYLREALARFPIPPMDEIPDEEQLRSQGSDGEVLRDRLRGTPVVLFFISGVGLRDSECADLQADRSLRSCLFLGLAGCGWMPDRSR
jgi:hypothetical protein